MSKITFSSDRKYLMKTYSVPTVDYLNELHAIEKLSMHSHPNIVSVCMIFNDEANSIYSFVFVSESYDLSRYLVGKKLSEEYKVLILRQVCRGLSFIHYNNLIHCDLKSDNILLSEKSSGDLSVRITDFGTSESIGPDDKFLHTSMIKGTPTHRPPEAFPSDLFSGGKYGSKIFILSKKFDIWSLGIIILEVWSNLPIYHHNIFPKYTSGQDIKIYECDIYDIITEFKFITYIKKHIPHIFLPAFSSDQTMRPDASIYEGILGRW